jgi:sterol desaturase/sphingolipid hydroxylase (fatty acid hydroxylase superfamily)
MLEFYAIVAAIFAFDALLLVLLAWMHHAARFAPLRLSTTVRMKVTTASRIKNIVASSTISLAAVLGTTFLGFDALFHHAPVSAWTILLEAAAILLIYDFAYYGLHRGMHHKKVMRLVHGVHHRAKNPSALESFYLHPAELLAGLFLLFAATFVVGPVHIYTFALVFFVYSTLNIVIHSGMAFGRRWLAPIDALTRKHQVHHMTDFGKNFASLTPLPDLVFKTAG